MVSAPIFWAILTNFGRLWRFIDDRYYHKVAKDWRKDKKKAKELHKELLGHYDFYQYYLGDRIRHCCDFLCMSKKKKKGKVRRKKKQQNDTKCCLCCRKKRRIRKIKSRSSDTKTDTNFTGIAMSTMNKDIVDAETHKPDKEGEMKTRSGINDGDENKSNNGEIKNSENSKSDNIINNKSNNKNNVGDSESSKNVHNNEKQSKIDNDKKDMFKTPLKPRQPPILTGPSSDERSKSPGDEKWNTTGKHTVLRSRLQPFRSHEFHEKNNTHKILYSQDFIKNQDDY